MTFQCGVEDQNTRLAGLLLSHGSYTSRDVLHTAILEESADMIRLLLNHGVSLDESTLYLAAAAGNMDMVKLSMDAGVDINTWETHDTPLTLTALNAAITEKDSLEMVSFLIDAGADINHPKANPTALEDAIGKEDTELTDFLLERRAYCDNPGVLVAAAYRMEPQVLKKLIDTITHQGTPHQPSHPCLYHPALAAASYRGRLENVEILLKHAVGIANHVSFPRSSDVPTVSQCFKSFLGPAFPLMFPTILQVSLAFHTLFLDRNWEYLLCNILLCPGTTKQCSFY